MAPWKKLQCSFLSPLLNVFRVEEKGAQWLLDSRNIVFKLHRRFIWSAGRELQWFTRKKITQCLYCNIVLWIMLFALQKCLNKHAHNKNMFKSCNQKSLYTHFWLPLTRLLCVRVHSLSKALKRDWKWLDSQGIFALIQFLHICTSNSAHLCFWRVERQKTIMSGYFFNNSLVHANFYMHSTKEPILPCVSRILAFIAKNIDMIIFLHVSLVNSILHM